MFNKFGGMVYQFDQMPAYEIRFVSIEFFDI